MAIGNGNFFILMSVESEEIDNSNVFSDEVEECWTFSSNDGYYYIYNLGHSWRVNAYGQDVFFDSLGELLLWLDGGDLESI